MSVVSIIAAAIVLLFAWYVLRTYVWQYEAKIYGTETEGTVSRIETEKRSADGADYFFRYYYVRFLREDGLETEARIMNPKKRLCAGSQVRICYLPERNSQAFLIGRARG